MRGRTVGLLPAVGLLLVALSTWAGLDQSKKPVDDFPSDVASVWFDTLFDIIKLEATSPPLASRIYGISAVALYEAIVPGTLHHQSLVGQLNDLTSVPQPKNNKKHHWPTVANTVLANTIRGLYPVISQSSLNAINYLEQSFASQYQVAVPKPAYERSVLYGQAVATAILGWAATDGFSMHNNCPYIPVPGAWEPTPPAFTPTPLQPCWGQLRPWPSPPERRARPRATRSSRPTPALTSMRLRSRSTIPA
jgi:hypothetical protein